MFLFVCLFVACFEIGSCYVTRLLPHLMIFLPQLSECENYRHVLPHLPLAYIYFSFMFWWQDLTRYPRLKLNVEPPKSWIVVCATVPAQYWETFDPVHQSAFCLSSICGQTGRTIPFHSSLRDMACVYVAFYLITLRWALLANTAILPTSQAWRQVPLLYWAI